MTVDIIHDVVEEFAKRLQLPECNYSFTISNNDTLVELIIMVDGEMKSSLSINNGSIRVVYDDEYGSKDYVILNFITPVTMVYYLCVFFYKAVHTVSDLDFNDILSVIFLNEIYDWKTLLQGLAENVGLSFSDGSDNCVYINDVEIHYSGFLNKIRIDTQEISLKDNSYTTAVEAMFKTVEYIANIAEVADNIFNIEEESNILEEPSEEEGGGGFPMGGSETDIDVDVNVPEGEEAEPVETVENETFEEPQGPVVTVEDVV